MLTPRLLTEIHVQNTLSRAVFVSHPSIEPASHNVRIVPVSPASRDNAVRLGPHESWTFAEFASLSRASPLDRRALFSEAMRWRPEHGEAGTAHVREICPDIIAGVTDTELARIELVVASPQKRVVVGVPQRLKCALRNNGSKPVEVSLRMLPAEGFLNADGSAPRKPVASASGVVITRIGSGNGDDLLQRRQLMPGEIAQTTFEILPIAAGMHPLESLAAVERESGTCFGISNAEGTVVYVHAS